MAYSYSYGLLAYLLVSSDVQALEMRSLIDLIEFLVGSLDRVRALHHLHRQRYSIQRWIIPRTAQPLQFRSHRDRAQHRTERDRRWLVRFPSLATVADSSD